MPPTIELCALVTFVLGPGFGCAPSRFVGPGPFAPNVGTELEENPAVSGFVLDGAAVEVPVEGKSGLAPLFVALGPPTLTWFPVAFVGTYPPGAVGKSEAKAGFATVPMAHLPTT